VQFIQFFRPIFALFIVLLSMFFLPFIAAIFYEIAVIAFLQFDVTSAMPQFAQHMSASANSTATPSSTALLMKLLLTALATLLIVHWRGFGLLVAGGHRFHVAGEDSGVFDFHYFLS
jgi:hypothetical protein